MGDYGPFGFDPDEFDRVIREGSEGLRDAFERIGRFLSSSGAGTGWSAIFEDLSRRSRPAPETAGEAGDGVWAIYTVDADGGARVEQVYATELDALRANKDNTDPKRKVRPCHTASRSASSTIRWTRPSNVSPAGRCWNRRHC
ncbi:putative transmembrane protein [Mycobacterium tuberculosis]|nr:putative transmembrane protein [Mycobacterium tuberculosis]